MGDEPLFKYEKSVKIIGTSFVNKKTGKQVKQFIVKLPKKIIDSLDIKPGDQITFTLTGDRKLEMRLIPHAEKKSYSKKL